MTTNKTRWALAAAPLLAIALVATAIAGDESAAPPSPSMAAAPADCEAIATQFSRKAEELAMAAERYRNWAAAEDVFRAATDGQSDRARNFQEQALRMDFAAAENRARAERYRDTAVRKAGQTDACASAPEAAHG